MKTNSERKKVLIALGREDHRMAAAESLGGIYVVDMLGAERHNDFTARIAGGEFHLLLTDSYPGRKDSPGFDGYVFVRDAGYKGPILIATGNSHAFLNTYGKSLRSHEKYGVIETPWSGIELLRAVGKLID